MTKYIQHKQTAFTVIGVIEALGGDKPCVYIITTNRPRNVVRVETTESIVKQFIPFLYKQVTAEFYKDGVNIK